MDLTSHKTFATQRTPNKKMVTLFIAFGRVQAPRSNSWGPDKKSVKHELVASFDVSLRSENVEALSPAS